VHRAERRARFSARTALHHAHAGLHHGVAPAEHVEAREHVGQLPMRAAQVGQHRVAPHAVVGLEELPAPFGRVFCGERPVVREHPGSAVTAALVRGADVAERRAVVDHVVPALAHAARGRPLAHVQVGHHPRAVGEAALHLGVALVQAAHHAVRHEARHGHDAALRDDPAQLAAGGVEDAELHALWLALHLAGHHLHRHLTAA
jgi:hypothetical protein